MPSAALAVDGVANLGTVTLSGTNTYSGDTLVAGNARTQLNINSASAISTGTLVIESSARVDNTSGSAITLANNNDVELGDTLLFVGSNELNLGSGTLILNAGTQSTLSVLGSTFTVGSIDASTTAKTFRKNGAGTLVISGAAGSNFQGDFTLAAGTLMIGNKTSMGTGTLLVTSGTLGTLSDLSGVNAVANTVSLGSNLNIEGVNHLELSGVISQTSGNRAVTITNTGITTLSNAANSYSGGTSLSGSGAVLAVSKLANGEANSSIGASTNAATNLRLGDGTTLRYIGAGDSTDRLIQLGGNSGAVITLDAAGTGAVNFTNTGSFAHDGSNRQRNLILTGTNTGANTLAYTLVNNGSGALSITKDGTGTWVLSGANTYTGETQVNAGTLIISSGHINSSAVTVAAGGNFQYDSGTARTGGVLLDGAGNENRATLSGTGPINVALTLDNVGDTLSPGNSPGIQNFGVEQTWNSFTYVWETNDFTGLDAGTDFDQITISAALNLTGGAGAYQLDLYSLTALDNSGDVPNFSETDRSWTILTAAGGINGFDAGNWTILTDNFDSNPDWTGMWAISQSGNDLVLNYYSVIPEPGVTGLLGLGLLLGAGLGIRRRKMVATGVDK